MIREARKGPFVPDLGGRPRFVQHVQVRLVDDTATISIDAGGDLLHRRGWRTEAGKAPMRENFAACLLALAEWAGTDALLDPFCGSGTIPIEGALLAAGRPPFLGRGFACDEWNAGKNRGGALRGRAIQRAGPGATPVRAPSQRPAPGAIAAGVPILGSDHHAPSILTASANARRAGVKAEFRHLDVLDLEPPAAVGTIVTNPPWGERIGERVGGVYAGFGRVLRERFTSWRVVFLTTDRGLAEKVDRSVERLVQFKSGGVSVSAWVYLP